MTKLKFRLHTKWTLLLFLILGFIINSCNNKNKDNYLKSIKLTKTVESDYIFDSVLYTEYLMYSIAKKNPKHYDEKLKEFKGIPALDSFMIVRTIFQTRPYIFDLYKKQQLDASYLKSFIGHEKDTLKLSKERLNYSLSAISGFRGTRQIVIVDANNNYDFSDDKELSFDIDYRMNTDSNKNDSLMDVTYQVVHDGNYYDIHRKVEIYPEFNHSESYMRFSNGDLDTTTNNYSLTLKLRDVGKGSFINNGISYTVANQGSNKEMSVVLIKVDSVNYDRTYASFQKNFEYRNGDTIKLSNNFYEIVLSNDMSQLSLKELDINPASFNGFKMGYTIKNFELTNLQDQKVNLYKQTDAQYTLIDFWGTWCAPCKELTPELKRIHDEYPTVLNIIGVAFDKSIDDVKSYAENNDMNWFQSYVDSNNRKGTIIPEMEIRSYPTFILIDKNRHIVYRGTSAKALGDIENIIKNNTGIN